MSGQTTEVSRKVCLEGLKPIMFDRYPGDNGTRLEPEQKFYTNDSGEIILPAINMASFLCTMNNECATQRVMGKKWKKIAKAAQSFVMINDGEDIIILQRDEAVTIETASWYKDHRVARLKGGIPNPITRPVLNLPWSLSFSLTIYENDDVDESILKTIFDKGGRALGLGNYRQVFGKFKIKSWK